MPRNPDPRARLPSIVSKFSSVPGLKGPEKAMFVRLGNLIDAIVVHERIIANPQTTMSKQVRNDIPVPQDVETEVILNGLIVKWSRVDYNYLAAYEVQYDDSVHFPDPTSGTTSGNEIVIRDVSSTDLYVRVRTIARSEQGVSNWSDTTSLTLEHGVYTVDSDNIFPENRTTVVPQPELIGQGLDILLGALGTVGVGGVVGPSPLTFSDFGNTTAHPHEVPRNQVTYALEENDVVQDSKTMGLPTWFNESTESTSFYPYDSTNYEIDNTDDRAFNSFTGSFLDFFESYSYTLNPAYIDVRFQRYRRTPHEQMGTVENAAHFLIKA
jgi:hypothetical protein